MLYEHPIKRELAKNGTYHCRVAGVEWGLDALLFSFSSSVKGKKRELTSVGKRKRPFGSPKFQNTIYPSNTDALKAMIFWLFQHVRLIL